MANDRIFGMSRLRFARRPVPLAAVLRSWARCSPGMGLAYSACKWRAVVGLAVVSLGLGCGGAHHPPARSAPAVGPETSATRPPQDAAANAPGTPVSEYERVKVSFEDPRHQAMLGNASYTVLHTGEEPVNELVQRLFVNLMGSGSFDFEASVRAAGGIEAYKQRIASYLTSPDVTARALAALALAIVGDKQFVEPLAALLRTKGLRVHLELLEGYDRGMAMLALAVLKATEFRPEIEAYTNSEISNESEGAKAALELIDR